MLEMVTPYLFNIIDSFILCLSVEGVSEEEQSEEEEDERENGNHIPTGEGGPINPDTRWLISVFYFMAFSFFHKVLAAVQVSRFAVDLFIFPEKQR